MISEYQWVSWKLRVLSFSVGESGNPIFEYRFTEKPPKSQFVYVVGNQHGRSIRYNQFGARGGRV